MKKNKRTTALILMLCVAMLTMLFSTACSSKAEKKADEEAFANVAEFDNSPHKKKGGGKYRLGYVDYDEYMPASRQFYYILKGLEELGWIEKGSLPFTISTIEANMLSTRNMYDMLVLADLGDYIEFAEDGFYYIGYDAPEDIEAGLKAHAGKDLDLVITFGTSAGLLVKEMDLPIPMVDFSATDPVASGIIESSTEGSGNPNVWAQVEPSVPLRQLKYYHSIQPFKKLGIIVYGDETISGVPDIMESAKEEGFEVVKYNIEERPREGEEELAEYYDLVEEKVEEMVKEGVDAFFVTVDLINDYDQLPRMLKHFYDKNIPVYMMDDVETVKDGGLMLILASDMENVGRFIADAIGKILNGAAAGSLPCIYTSSPGIYLNYAVARKIGYPVNFELLTVCDDIFTEE